MQAMPDDEVTRPVRPVENDPSIIPGLADDDHDDDHDDRIGRDR